MKIRITIDGTDGTMRHRSQVLEQDVEILDKRLYITKVSILGEGEPQPICEVPFAIGCGYYLWIPPSHDDDGEAFGSLMDAGD